VDTFDKLKIRYEKNPKDVLTTFKLALKYDSDQLEADKAKELLNRVLERSNEARKTIVEHTEPGSKISLYEWALYRRGQLEGTIPNDYYKKLVLEFPDTRYADTIYPMLSGYMFREKPEDAEFFYSNLIRKYPKDIKLVSDYLAYCINTKSHIDEGIKIGSNVRSMNSSFLYNMNNMLINYSRLLEMKGDSSAFENIFGSSYVESMKRDISLSLSNYLAYWGTREGNEKGKELAAEIILKLDSEGLFKTNAFNALKKLGKIDKLLELYGPEYVKTIDNKPAELLQYAYFWITSEKNSESALQALERYRTLVPQTKVVNDIIYLETIYKKLGRDEEANKIGTEYIEANKSNPSTLNSYAWRSALQKGNLDNALKAINIAIEKAPQNEMHWDTLSMVYWKMGEYQKALEAEEKAISINPKESYKQRIEDIKKDIAKIKK
jgi:tetratricopeptide (TPR) repeat protein